MNDDIPHDGHEDVFEPIALTVTELRVLRGWTQTQLAQRAGVKCRTIEEGESARADDLRIDTLLKLANALSVPAEQLVEPRRRVRH